MKLDRHISLLERLTKTWVSHEDAYWMGYTTLSQRVSEWRAEGHTIISRRNKQNPRRFDYKLTKIAQKAEQRLRC